MNKTQSDVPKSQPQQTSNNTQSQIDEINNFFEESVYLTLKFFIFLDFDI
jgi:hypothetical protein